MIQVSLEKDEIEFLIENIEVLDNLYKNPDHNKFISDLILKLKSSI